MWQCNNFFRKVGQRINEATAIIFAVIEGAAFSKFAFSSFLPVFARCSLKVRQNRTGRALPEVLGKRIVGLSQLLRSMSELAELFERASFVLHKVLADHGLVLLLEQV